MSMAWGASGQLPLTLDGLPWFLDLGVPQQRAGGWALVIIAIVSPSYSPLWAPQVTAPSIWELTALLWQAGSCRATWQPRSSAHYMGPPWVIYGPGCVIY